MMTRAVVLFAAAVLGTLPGLSAHAQTYSGCGGFDKVPGGYGPFDYRRATADQRYLVEGSHFTQDVETLRKGRTSEKVGADIAYTLGVFPNHPRALLSMSNLGERTKMAKPPGAKWSVDCYFDRAVRWRPDDQFVRLIFGVHLTRRGQKDAARAQLEIAHQNPIDDGSFHYNLGLALLEVGDADRALIHAWRAHELGYELPGLRRGLEKIGKWRDAEK